MVEVQEMFTVDTSLFCVPEQNDRSKGGITNRVVHPGDELSENNRNPGDNLGKFCNPGRFCTSMITNYT